MNVIHTILAEATSSISDFKKNPMAVVNEGAGSPVAILNRNKPAFYCIPAESYESLIEKLEDAELALLAKERMEEDMERVSLDEL